MDAKGRESKEGVERGWMHGEKERREFYVFLLKITSRRRMFVHACVFGVYRRRWKLGQQTSDP